MNSSRPEPVPTVEVSLPDADPAELRPMSGGRSFRFAGNGVPFLTFLQAAPLAAVLIVFMLLPMFVLVVVSFFDYDSVQIIPAFQFTNYIDVLGSAVTWRTYLNTVRFTLIVWAVTAVLGFTIAYVLAFEIRNRITQMVLFLVCTVPFLTSNIIRMISWIPFLGREGLLNTALIQEIGRASVG